MASERPTPLNFSSTPPEGAPAAQPPVQPPKDAVQPGPKPQPTVKTEELVLNPPATRRDAGPPSPPAAPAVAARQAVAPSRAAPPAATLASDVVLSRMVAPMANAGRVYTLATIASGIWMAAVAVFAFGYEARSPNFAFTPLTIAFLR